VQFGEDIRATGIGFGGHRLSLAHSIA
jgi:hypothetical protein